MTIKLRGASGMALIAGLASVFPAWAQEAQTAQTSAPQDVAPSASGVDQTNATQDAAPAQDRVVITGSLIAGASEDAPLAVDVFDIEDLKDQGSPNVQEFARSLTQAGETTGEPSILLGVGGAGTSNISLRGLGAARTLTLLNGRRTTENTNAIPTGALQRVEVLKEGAGVTYGAGAVAGVVNFVTRRDVDGLEITAEQKFYDGSDGEFELNALTGWVGDSSNFLLSATYSHQGNLPFTERPNLQFPYEQLPLQYTGGTTSSPNPGSYFLGSSATVLRDYNQASCNELGGFSRADTECFYSFTPFYDLVNEETTVRGYSEFNADLNDSMEFHVEAAYARSDAPHVTFSPAGNPVISHRAVVGTTANAANSTLPTRMYQIPVVNDDWNGAVAGGGVRNPFVDKFFNDLRSRFGDAVAGATNPTAGSLYTGSSWRVFAQGGNPAYDYGARRQRAVRDFFQTAGSLKGDFQKDTFFGLLAGVNYSHSLSFDQSVSEVYLPDQITANVQNAMRGYGGPNCAAIDRIATDFSSVDAFDRTVGIQDPNVAPGTQGCLWFNPFASAYAKNPQAGTAFSGFGGAGFENPKELVDWLHADRGTETQTQNLTFDSVFSGTVPYFELPGGEIGWALGGQWRSEEVRTRVLGSDELRELSRQPCVFQDQVTGDTVVGMTTPICSGDKPGIWVENADQIDTDSYSDRHTYSGFAELQVPVLDNLNFQLGFRRENFDGLEGDIYKVAGKWDIFSSLAVRASWSTNFTAPPIGLRPGVLDTGVTFDTTFLSTVPTTRVDASGIVPEEATNTGFGIVWAPTFGENEFRLSADYFDIDDQNQIVSIALRTILNQIAPTAASFQTDGQTIAQVGGGRDVSTARIDCDAPLMAFVTLSSACVPGTTTAGQISDILLTRLNGPGQRTSGIDYALNYTRPFLDGTFNAGITATQVLTYEVEGYALAGVPIETSGDRLGFINDARSGEFSSEWRANANIGFTIGAHTLRAQANYIKGVEDELGCAQAVAAPGGTAPPPACFGVFPDDYIDYDLHWRYQAPFMKDLELRLSVLNLTDVDPPGAQRARDGYLSAIAPDGARGRQIEIGLSKKF